MRIVIIEDEIKTMQGLVSLIHKHTCHTVVGQGKNGLEGMALVMRYKPDLVITDIRMPEMDGIEMITALKEKGENHQTIILSGYSDFVYAQQAIKLGVSEYLLKPITLEDIQNSLKNIENKLLQENQRQGTGISVEELYRNIVLSSADNEKQVLEDINKRCRADGTTGFTLFMAYLGGCSEAYETYVIKLIVRYFERFDHLRYYIVRVDTKRELMVILQGNLAENMTYEEFNRNVVAQVNTRYHEESIWIATSFTGISAFKERVSAMRKQLRWSIVLGIGNLLIYPVEAYTSYQNFQYPFEIESKIKKAICNENSEGIRKYSKDFLHIICRNKYYPDSIIEAFVKLVSAVFLMIRELNTGLYEQLGHQEYLKQIMEAITLNELSSIYNGLIEKIILSQEKKEDISNFTIKRALNYIKNNYKEGITLEETALNMDITPEYLSMLFNREVGTNFNLFIKEFRIGKAKKLLIGSDMKIYEIAQEVGYNDSKYFCRVFKEIVGLSPSDYRNTN